MNKDVKFTARSHAYLFGIIAKKIIDTYNEPGTQAIIHGVIKYGRQRGSRMLQRTIADGFEPTILNYIAYGEWSAEPGEMDASIPSSNPDVQFLVKKCPWYDVWEKNHLIDNYGYLYCKYVDIAIAQGYNPAIRFDILKNRSSGGDTCDMRMRNAYFSEKDRANLAVRIKELGNKAKMPWIYHCAHLYKTMWEEATVAFGRGGQDALNDILTPFEAYCGRNSANTMLKLMNIDFNVASVWPEVDEQPVLANNSNYSKR